jgi:acyl-CoA thioester hydrolase
MISVDTIIRVRYADTDKMGFVYYANYLVYFEVGRTEFIRKNWKPYSYIESQGYILPVIACGAEFKDSARYDDLLTVKTILTEFNKIFLNFNYEIFRGEANIIATGFTRHCFTTFEGRPRRMPKELWETLSILKKQESPL